jgi:nucleolar protein 14
MAMESRARAAEKAKTPEEAAKEERERLEQLEKERIMRMKGIDVPVAEKPNKKRRRGKDKDSANGVPEKSKKKLTNPTDDDLVDNFAVDRKYTFGEVEEEENAGDEDEDLPGSSLHKVQVSDDEEEEDDEEEDDDDDGDEKEAQEDGDDGEEEEMDEYDRMAMELEEASDLDDENTPAAEVSKKKKAKGVSFGGADSEAKESKVAGDTILKKKSALKPSKPSKPVTGVNLSLSFFLLLSFSAPSLSPPLLIVFSLLACI